MFIQIKARKAIATLLNSTEYGVNSEKRKRKFCTNEEAESFLVKLHEHKLFYRAKRMVLRKERNRNNGENEEEIDGRHDARNPSLGEMNEMDEKGNEDIQSYGDKIEKMQFLEKEKQYENKTKKQKKIKLHFTDEQRFATNTNDVYGHILFVGIWNKYNFSLKNFR